MTLPPHLLTNNLTTKYLAYNLSGCIAVLCAVACLAACAPAQSQNQLLTKEERSDGFVPLFNGKNLKGWHSYLRDNANEMWQVDSGSIMLKAGGGGDLTTNREFTNYIFRFEWKISAGGNSGIIYKVNESPQYKATYLSGIEYQVLDNEKHKDGALRTHRASSAYDLLAPTDSANPQPNQWHQGEIIVNGTKISHSLDGKKVVEFDLTSNDFLEKLAKSKFAKWQGFAKSPTGRIALQDHGDRVWYRNLRIKKIK